MYGMETFPSGPTFVKTLVEVALYVVPPAVNVIVFTFVTITACVLRASVKGLSALADLGGWRILSTEFLDP